MLLTASHVADISPSDAERLLMEEFKKFGDVDSVSLANSGNSTSRRNSGCGFVNFKSGISASLALNADVEINKRTLRIQCARRAPPNSQKRKLPNVSDSSR